MATYPNPVMPEQYIANAFTPASVLYSAAGATPIIANVPVTASAPWEIVSISFFYRSTSTAGNRLPGLSITLPGTLYPLYLWTCPYNVPASTKLSVSGGAGGPSALPPDQASTTLAPSDPAASSLTVTLSSNFAHRIQSLRFVYTTDGTAGTRLVEVQLQDPSSNIIGESFSSTQAASLAYVYAFGLGVQANAQAASLHEIGPLPTVDLQPGSKIKIQDANGIAAGDRVTATKIADLQTQSVLPSTAVGFAPLPLPTPMRVPKGTIITVYDTLNVDANDTIELYITGISQ